jgi:uncharacterized membrane protein
VADRERDLERLLTFVDAVVAIAITLLVLPLADIGLEVRTGQVTELLRDHVDDLLGFFLSFVVIARLWLAQHAIVSGLVRQSASVTRLLLAWTMTIVFLPFPTAVITNTTDDVLARVLYIGTMATSSMLLAGLAFLISRDPGLRDTDAGPDPVVGAGIAVGFLVALGVSLLIPASGLLPLLLLLLVDPVVHGARWLRRRGAGAGGLRPGSG